MSDQHIAELLFVAPFAFVWTAMTVAETVRVVAAIREARRGL